MKTEWEIVQYKQNSTERYTFCNEELAKKLFAGLEACNDSKLELYKIDTTSQLVATKVYTEGDDC